LHFQDPNTTLEACNVSETLYAPWFRIEPVSASIAQMSQANDSNDFIRENNRRFRDLSWRVERLESTQMPARSLNEAFDRVYEEIDTLEEHMNQRFDQLDREVREMKTELNGLNGKIDIVMQHITGTSPSP
jgi:chromosome segregation ATPase